MVAIPEFMPKADWKAPKLSELPRWPKYGRVGFDTETNDPFLKDLGPGVRRGGKLVGFSFAFEESGFSAYLPIGHASGNLDPEHVLQYMKDQARDFKGELVLANGHYDLDYCEEYDIKFRPSKHLDVLVAEPLIDELQFSYGLDNVLRRRGFEGKEESLLERAAYELGLDPKRGMHQLPAEFVGQYAEYDAECLLPLLRDQERDIEEQKLSRPWDLECRLLPVLLKMRRRGVKIDLDRLDQVEQYFITQEISALKEITRKTGIQLTREDTNKKDAAIDVLAFAGISRDQLPQTAKGNPSIKNEWLQELKDPLAALLFRAKKFNKIRQFCDSMREHEINGRIHTEFVQCRGEKEGSGGEEGGARFGRLASRNPNLQQQPSPDRDPEVAGTWRKIFVQDPGTTWWQADYSQQEPRWMIHWAEAVGAVGAKEAGDRFRADPNTDNHDMTTQLFYGMDAWNSWSKEERKLHRYVVKAINLGLSYEMGPGKLAKSLDQPYEVYRDHKGREKYKAGPETYALLNQYHEKLPYVKGFSKSAMGAAGRMGYVCTILGRRCRFEYDEAKEEFTFTYRAGNRVVQGSAGDQTKMALVLADEAGLEVNLQVHDEIDACFESEKEAKLLEEVMLEAVPCSVPHKVDLESGPSWGEVK